MSSREEVRVPDLGDFDDVEIVEIMVQPGAQVVAEDPLITLETDKAAMEVPSPQAGTVAEITVEVGGRVSAGDVIAILEVEDQSAAETADEPPPEPEPPRAADASPADAPPAPAGEARKQPLTVPDLGDFDTADIAEVHIKPGDDVAVDDPLITLETDKAAMDVPAPVAGRIVSVAVEAGAQITAGDVIGEIESSDAAPSIEDTQTIKPIGQPPAQTPDKARDETPDQAPPPPAAAPAPKQAPPAEALPAINEAGFRKAHASPSVRRLARELGVDLGRVTGTGAKARVLKEDVKAYVKAALTLAQHPACHA
jgi:pyruvate dehydrogenase E2 component (dihydrolipoamide acetyltransferase)